MQLKNKKAVRSTLVAATCALLGSGHVAMAQAADSGKNWKIDTALLQYSEDGRVDATEPTIKARRTFSGDRVLGLNLVFDTLTGASPSGAAPGSTAQTFTRPSGAGLYIAPPGETPLDDTFHDTRTQVGASWEAPINRLTRYNVGLNISSEFDYDSIGVSGGLSRDFNKKNTTLSLGVALASDDISPIGGIPVARASMLIPPATGTLPRGPASESKDVTDIVLGLTQVINANTLMQFNVGTSQSDGYLSDPFKILTVVDTTGNPVDYVYENRPDSRSKNFFYWDTKYHTGWGDTVNFSYRLMTDDWGIDSDTFDFRYRWNATEKLYVEPHFRVYQQTAADFYRQSLKQAEVASAQFPVMDFSADSRLGEFDGTTVGFKVGYLLGEDQEVNLRLESYKQEGDNVATDAVGVLSRYELFPDMDATIIQVGYSFTF